MKFRHMKDIAFVVPIATTVHLTKKRSQSCNQKEVKIVNCFSF